MDHTIVRKLDMTTRIDSACYFCGSTKNVNYALTNSLSITGATIDKEVACCGRCLKHHIYPNDLFVEEEK